MSARFRSLLLVSLAALLAVSVVPSAGAAALVRWTDQSGDAHYRSDQTGPIAALSQPAWDITAATVESSGKRVRWETSLLDLSAPFPVLVHGRVFSYGFRYNGAFFQLGVYETDDDPTTWFSGWLAGPDGRGDTSGRAQALPCPDCRAWFDTRHNSVVLTVSVDTLARGIRRLVPNAPIGVGTLLEDIYVAAGPIYDNPLGSTFSLRHDMAPAPAPGSFQL